MAQGFDVASAVAVSRQVGLMVEAPWCEYFRLPFLFFIRNSIRIHGLQFSAVSDEIAR